MIVRALVEAVAAIATTVVLGTMVPASDPLLVVVIVVPGTAVLMAQLGRWIVSAGGEPLDSTWSKVESIAVVSLIILSLTGQGLGALPRSMIVGGFVLVLAARTARMVIAARSCLAVTGRPSLIFFVIPLLVYCCLVPWSAQQRQPDGDEPYFLLVTHSLVNDFDLDLSNDYEYGGWRRFMQRAIEPQIGDPTGPAGEVYSRHGAVLPMILAPAYAIGGRLGAMVMMATMAAALAWMTLHLALLYGLGFEASLVSYSLVAFTSPLLVYSSQIWVEVPAALLVAIGLEQIRRARAPGKISIPGIASLLGAILLLPVLKMRFAALSVSLVAVFVLRSRPSRAARLAVGCSLAASAVVVALINYSHSGRVLGIYSLADILLAERSVVEGIRGFGGVLFDCAFGLMPAAPVWVLLLPAGWTVLKWYRRSAIDALILAAPYTIAIAPRIEWYGGWSPPFRYFVVLLPIAALAIASLFHERNDVARPRTGLRFVMGATVAATVVLSTIWIVVPGWTYNFADGGNHILDRYSQRLGLDLVRFLPSMIRPRPASWWWPLCAVAIVPLVGLRKWPWAGSSLKRSSVAARWGAVITLLSTGLLVTAARTVPTTVVEAEDAQVRRVDAELDPEQWTMQRSRFRGGLALAEGASFSAPVIADGEQVELGVWVRTTGQGVDPVLALSATGERWRTITVESREWQRVLVGPVEWSPGSHLLVVAEESVEEKRRVVVVDRVELEWKEADR